MSTPTGPAAPVARELGGLETVEENRQATGLLSAFVVLLSEAGSGTHAALFDGVILAEHGTAALPLFEDTFERGNLSAWHLSTP